MYLIFYFFTFYMGFCILHKGAGTYIWMFKISALSSLENRATYKHLVPVSSLPKVTLNHLIP